MQSGQRRPAVTAYRLINTTLILVFGLSKAVLSYQGLSVAPTTLELVFGTFITILLYWLGYYETIEPPVLLPLFHKDYGRSVEVFKNAFPGHVRATRPLHGYIALLLYLLQCTFMMKIDVPRIGSILLGLVIIGEIMMALAMLRWIRRRVRAGFD